jgi:peptide/nickel transport system permease protein
VNTLVLRRLGALLGVLFALTIVVFLIQSVIPLDPVRAQLGPRASEELVKEKRHELGYDKPLPVQYLNYMGRVLHGDLGDSLRTRNPVTRDLKEFAPATAELAIVTFLFAGLLGLFFGTTAVRPGKGADAVRTSMIAFASIPTFFIAILLILLFYRRLNWLPASGRIAPDHDPDGPTGFMLIDTLLKGDPSGFVDAGKHLLIPAICLALGPAIAIGRTMRVSLLDVMDQDYVRTARSKGISERRVVMKHGMRNALGPVLAISGLMFGFVLAGATVVEQVVGWPGLGLYTTQSIQSVDFPAVTGVVLVLGIVYVTVNAAVDIVQLVADPRMRAATAS